MFPNILSKEQTQLLPLVKKFSEDHFLVGGTAIALQIGHRMSIDFDLFTPKKIKKPTILKRINESKFPFGKIIFEDEDQFHIPVNSVKMTFYHYMFPVKRDVKFETIITMPGLLDLAAMKVHALGGRAKWRDYVDLYFLLKYHHELPEIAERANDLLGGIFNARLLKEQLSYFTDIDYSQPIEYIGTPISDEEIKAFLTEVATTAF